MAQLPNLPQELRSVQVLVRFGLRIIILLTFAAFGSIGFGRSLVALLWMAAILSAVVGALRREPPFDTVLNHWDETMAYRPGLKRLRRLCGSYEIAVLSLSNSYPAGKILGA